LNYQKQYVIPFSGLSENIHHFEFKIDDKFFENFEFSEIKKSNIDVYLSLEKQERMLILEFLIEGTTNIMCDRCLDFFDYPIKGKEKLIVKFGNKNYESTDDILILAESENEIDISKYIYEFISLLLPIKRIHPEDENGNSRCNKEMIKKIKEFSKTKKSDGRWDELKKII